MNLISLERLKKALESFYDRISNVFATKSEMTTGLNKKSDTGHSHNNATVTSNGYMSKDDKAKLDGIATGANKYTHPSTHAASMITQDSTHRFVTDTEKSTWNAKASTSVASSTANGLMSSSDKSKLDGIAQGAQVNADITKAEIEAKLTGTISSHNHSVLTMKSDNYKDNSALPSTYERGETLFFSNNPSSNKFNNLTYGLVQTLKEYGSGSAAFQWLYPYNSNADTIFVRHAMYGTDTWREWAEVYTSLNKPTLADLSGDATHRLVTDTEKSTWNAKASTSVASSTANGLMSSSDKSKLDGIAQGAQVNANITKAEIEAKLTGAITSHTHKYAGSSSAGGAATSANKLATARNITIGNKTNSFNGTAAITYTLADIGAASASEAVLKGDDITTIDYTLESTFSNKIGALSNLNTTTQTSIVDAINEVFQSGNNVKGNLVDALVAKGMDISTSESWDNIITAVRDFSGGLNVIAASSLPSTGSENQICVITDSPTTNIVVTHNDTFTASGDEIVVYLREHVDYLTPISITSGGVTNDYYIDYVLQNGTSCEAYVYQSGNWNKVAGKCIFLLKNGTAKDITWNTTAGTYYRYMAGTGVYLSTYSSSYYSYFTTSVTLTKNYSKARVKGVYTRGQASYNYKLYVGGRTSSAASYSTTNYATYSVNNTLPGTGQTYASKMIDMEFDISSLSLSNNYFIVQLYAAYSTQMGVTITDIILVE